MAGNDIRSMSADVSAILRNPRLLAVNQDSLGAGGRRARDDGPTEVFAAPLSDGSVAVGLFSRGEVAATVSTTGFQVGLSGGPFRLTDLGTGTVSSTSGQISASVPAHGVAVFRVTGGSPPAATTTRLRGNGSGHCVGVDDAFSGAGATVLLWGCHTAANQLWTTWTGGEIGVYGDKCLDAYNQGTTEAPMSSPGLATAETTRSGSSSSSLASASVGQDVPRRRRDRRALPEVTPRCGSSANGRSHPAPFVRCGAGQRCPAPHPATRLTRVICAPAPAGDAAGAEAKRSGADPGGGLTPSQRR